MHNLSIFAAEAEGSGLSALGVDPRAFLIQLITFVLVFLVLKRYAFKPILKVLDERRETIESGVKLGEEMQKERSKLDAKIEDELRKARARADEIIAGAQDTSRQIVQEAEVKARDKASGIIEAAEARLAQDTARARKQLEKEVVELISEATEVIIGEKVDAKKDAALMDRALKESRAL
jgi:F-type H+-transporting ATPase subunit b